MARATARVAAMQMIFERFAGGQRVISPAPIESIPVFARADAVPAFKWIENTGL